MVTLTLTDVPECLAPVIAVVIPSVFVFLWGLLTGDLRNFKSSKKAYSEYSAVDAVNCYLLYKPKTT